MNQLLKKFIPLGDTGSICYLEDTLKDFDSNNIQLIQTRLKELQAKKIQKLILLHSLTKKIDLNSITDILDSSKFQFVVYIPNSELQKEVELFETILDSNTDENIAILFHGESPSLLKLIGKLVLYIEPKTPIEDIYSFITDETPDIVTLNELKTYVDFLENDPYLLTKPDRSEFQKISSIHSDESSKPTPDNSSTGNTEFTLNLNSLKNSIPDNEPLLTETEAITFNLNSLVESDFEKEESPEEHNQKLKETAKHEVEESLSLDVDLSEEIEYISSLESLSSQKDSIPNIDTIPLEEEPNLAPTIDYKNKEFIDFDALIEDELEQGMITEELGEDFLENKTSDFPAEIDFENIIPDEKDDSLLYEDDTNIGNSKIDLEIIDSKDNEDLPQSLEADDHYSQVEEKIKISSDKVDIFEDPIDPSQTFMVKRINDVIKNEVLNEDSKSKIPVSDLTQVETESKEAIKLATNPTAPKISNPKFNPIPLDD